MTLDEGYVGDYPAFWGVAGPQLSGGSDPSEDSDYHFFLLHPASPSTMLRVRTYGLISCSAFRQSLCFQRTPPRLISVPREIERRTGEFSRALLSQELCRSLLLSIFPNYFFTYKGAFIYKLGFGPSALLRTCRGRSTHSETAGFLRVSAGGSS